MEVVGGDADIGFRGFGDQLLVEGDEAFPEWGTPTLILNRIDIEIIVDIGYPGGTHSLEQASHSL